MKLNFTTLCIGALAYYLYTTKDAPKSGDLERHANKAGQTMKAALRHASQNIAD